MNTPKPAESTSVDSIVDPELEEAVKHVFKIDISDTAPSQAEEQTEDSSSINPVMPDNATDFVSPIEPDAGDQLISNEVIHENDIAESIQLPTEVVEPESPAIDEKENFSDNNINETFDNTDQKSGIGNICR